MSGLLFYIYYSSLTYNADGTIIRPGSSSAVAPAPMPAAGRRVGDKSYELNNHLGNVMAVVSDKKIGISTASPATDAEQYKPDVISSQDYYAFGALMNGRKFNTTAYRYGFNGKEKEDEINDVEGGDLDFGARMYDARLGKWLSLDPKMKNYSAIAPYTYVNNNPIFWQDKEGKELWLGENREFSIADIKSLVPPRFQTAIVVSSDGKVTLDASLIDDPNKVWDGNDEGLKLLMNLIDAPEKYLYEANNKVVVTYENNLTHDKTQFEYDLVNEPWQADGGNGVINVSKEYYYENKDVNYDQFTPKEGFDGQVGVNITFEYDEDINPGSGTTLVPKNRSSVVFHELKENYERTTNHKKYKYRVYGSDNKPLLNGRLQYIFDMMKKGAHELANEAEGGFWQKSNSPGVASPNRQRKAAVPEICPAYN